MSGPVITGWYCSNCEKKPERNDETWAPIKNVQRSSPPITAMTARYPRTGWRATASSRSVRLFFCRLLAR